MAESATDICNLSIRMLGVGKPIEDIDSDTSNEAKVCRTFYEDTLKDVLSEFPWPFATKIETLGLVEEDPNDEWSYSYTYPSDCILARRILSGIRNDTDSSKVPYKIVHSSSGKLIYTDTKDAELEYTAFVEDVHNFPSYFSIAFARKLATMIAPSFGGTTLVNSQMQMYMLEIQKAKASAVNEEQADLEPNSGFQNARK